MPAPAAKSLGSFFPSASVLKASPPSSSTCSLLLFYHYARPPLASEQLKSLKAFLEGQATRRNLGGRLRIAREGLNCTISGDADSLRAFSRDLAAWDDSTATATATSTPSTPPFAAAEFKYVDDLPLDRAFKDCKILPVNELVFYGVGEQEAPLDQGGVHLEPKEYHEKMKEKNTVIVDVRNAYEAEIGNFTGQGAGGAEYIDPKMRKSTDFKAWLDRPETQEKLEGKTVMMYCTGGVRCERASALLKNKIGDRIGDVYQ
ncbi:hypothetical protein TeGR_g1883, partial [Tetraparma gracilis]